MGGVCVTVRVLGAGGGSCVSRANLILVINLSAATAVDVSWTCVVNEGGAFKC